MMKLAEIPSASPIEALAILSAAFVAWYVVSSLVAWYPLRAIPGPFIAKFSRHYISWVSAGGRQAYVHRDLFTRYNSPLVRIGPHELSSSDPEVARKIAAARGSYGRHSSYAAGIRHPQHLNMLVTVDTKKHDKLKAKLMPVYSGKAVEGLEPCVDEQIGVFLGLLQQKATESRGFGRVDLSKLLSYLSVDIISQVAMGEALGNVRTNTDVFGLIGSTQSAMQFVTLLVDTPWLADVFFKTPVMKWLGPNSKDEDGLGRVLRFAEDAVAERYQPGAEDRMDMVSMFKKGGLSRGAAESESVLAFVAGSETTASAMRTTILHLITSPRIYYKFKNIIAEEIREGRASSPIKQEEAKRIPYLQALIYEGLRMRPPGPALFLKVVPPEGDYIDGHFIPGGTSISANHLALMHSPVFGPDPELFRPERFAEAEQKTRAEMERVTELMFGYGRFVCAGKPFAFMELNKIFFEIFRMFDIQLVNPAEPMSTINYSSWVDTDFWVTVTENHV